MEILGHAVAVTVFSGIGNANDVVSRVLAEHLEQRPFPEVTIMVLFGLALLGVSAFIRWRMRT